MRGRGIIHRCLSKDIILLKAFKRVIKAFFYFVFSFLLVVTQMPFVSPQLLKKAYAYENIYYVAKGGSDSNPGTEGQPWRTIQKAANTLQPGDIVYIKQGVYREAVTPANHGSSGSPITYEAYGDDEVVISGAEDRKGTGNWAQDSGSIYYTTGINWTPLQVFQDEERLVQKNTKAEMEEGTWYFDNSADRVYTWANGGSNPGSYQIDISKRVFCFQAAANYTVLSKLTMEYANDSISSDDRNANLRILAHHVTADNCKSRKARLNNIFIGDSSASYATIRNCSDVNHAGKVGIFVRSASNFNISNNVINYNGNYSWYGGGVGIEIMGYDFLGPIDAGTINGNETGHNGWGNYLTHGNGIELYGVNNVVSNITVTNNRAHHNVNYGIDLATNARYCTTEYNVCYDNGRDPGGFGRQINAYGNSYGNRIAFNLLYNFGAQPDAGGVQLWNYCHDNEVYNNTFINSISGQQKCLQIGATSKNCKVKNNIFIMENTNGSVMKIWADSQEGFESDYNDLILRSGDCLVQLGNSKYYNLQSWQQMSQDAHSKSVDPQFENEQALNYCLRSTSPCIDQGIDVGLPYSGSAPDMGAYEYQGSPTPPQVSLTSPPNLASGVSVNTTVKATFNKDMDLSTINSNTFTLYLGLSKANGNISYDSPTRTATFSPTVKLSPNSTYTATLTTGVKDLLGESLATNYSWSFTTYPIYEGEVLVRFKDGIAKDEINSICSSLNTLVVDLARIGSKVVYVIRVQDGSSPNSKVTRLKYLPQVEYAELNSIWYGVGEEIIILEEIAEVSTGESISSLASAQNIEQLPSLTGGIQLNLYIEPIELDQITSQRLPREDGYRKNLPSQEHGAEEKYLSKDNCLNQLSLGKIWSRVRAWYEIALRKVGETVTSIVDYCTVTMDG